MGRKALPIRKRAAHHLAVHRAKARVRHRAVLFQRTLVRPFGRQVHARGHYNTEARGYSGLG